MFAVGSYVVYGRSGVCRVDAIGNPGLIGFDNTVDYYTLQPVYGTETVYVPVDTQVLLREIMSEEAARQLLDEVPADIVEYRDSIPKIEQKELLNYYRSLISTCEVTDLLKLLTYVNSKKVVNASNGRKLCQTDKTYNSKAEGLLYGEIAVALGIDIKEVEERMNKRYFA